MYKDVNFRCDQTKIAKPASGSAKNYKNKSLSVEALKATIQRKKESTARALGIVIHFSEGVVTEQCLLENAYYINQCHFQDITEERAILKICGYPVCGKKLKEIPKKQYHISTKQNKVFDITDRKNFCSNLCYKASKFLQDQLLTSPLWLRTDEKRISFRLLPLESRTGISGVEVDIGLSRVTQDQIDKTEVGCSLEECTSSVSRVSYKDINCGEDYSRVKESKNSCDEECDDRSTVNINQCIVYKDENCDVEREQVSNNGTDKCSGNDSNASFHEEKNINNINEHISSEAHEPVKFECGKTCLTGINEINDSRTERKSENMNKIKLSDKSEITQNERSKIKQEMHNYLESDDEKEIHIKHEQSKERSETKLYRMKKENRNKKGYGEETEPVNIVLRIEHSIREWITIDSLCFIYGIDKVKELLAVKGKCIDEWHHTCGNAMMDPYLYDRYLAICRKLKVLEVEDSRLDTEVTIENNIKPHKPLPDYSSLLEESKNIELKVKQFYKGDTKVTFQEAEEKSVENNEENDRATVLPLVDLHAQRSLRRRIVLDKLNRVVIDVIRLLGLKGFDVREEVRTLVSTFTLSAHNITFRPTEWNLIALAIIKLLSVKDETLAKAVYSASVMKRLTLMLMSYQLDGGYLDRLADWLTDIEYIIKTNSEVV